MTAPVLSNSGSQTPHRLHTWEINMTSPLSSAAPLWTPLNFVEDDDFNPDDGVMSDSGIFADGGFGNQDKLGASWHATVTVNHMVVPGSNPPVYDPAAEFLKNTAIGKFGPQNRAQIRVYDFDVNDLAGLYTPRGDAFMGFCSVTYPMYGSGKTTDNRLVAIAFQGKGPLYPIAHPYPVTPAVPVVTAVTPNPAAVAGGQLLTITGSGFGGATALTIGGNAVPANAWTVESGSLIRAVAPAHAAGSGLPVVVTTPAGSSTTGTVAYA